MLFPIYNVILFGVIIGPTRVAVSPVGMLPTVGLSRGGLQHYKIRIIWFWSQQAHISLEASSFLLVEDFAGQWFATPLVPLRVSRD